MVEAFILIVNHNSNCDSSIFYDFQKIFHRPTNRVSVCCCCVVALRALVLLFSSVCLDVAFKNLLCYGWKVALVTFVWLLPTVKEQMILQIFCCTERFTALCASFGLLSTLTPNLRGDTCSTCEGTFFFHLPISNFPLWIDANNYANFRTSWKILISLSLLKQNMMKMGHLPFHNWEWDQIYSKLPIEMQMKMHFDISIGDYHLTPDPIHLLNIGPAFS